MGADLHIHVMTKPCTEKDLAIFFESTMDSRWFQSDFDKVTLWDSPERKEAWDHVTETPNMWIGEVSWLKAALFDDADSYIPQPVEKVQEVFNEANELLTLTPEAIDKICEAVRLPVQEKASYYQTEKKVDEVRAFLQQYVGQQAFTVSW